MRVGYGIPDWSPLKQGTFVIGMPKRPKPSTNNADEPPLVFAAGPQAEPEPPMAAGTRLSQSYQALPVEERGEDTLQQSATKGGPASRFGSDDT